MSAYAFSNIVDNINVVSEELRPSSHDTISVGFQRSLTVLGSLCQIYLHFDF
jgi:hypothetical protein